MSIPSTILRMSAEELEQGLRRFDRIGKPVIIQGGCRQLAESGCWKEAPLRERFGATSVRYYCSSHSIHPDLREEKEIPARPSTTSLSVFLDALKESAGTSASGQIYVTGDLKTSILAAGGERRPGMQEICDEISLSESASEQTPVGVGLWVSGARARTWLHYESRGLSLLAVQLVGRSRATLYSPDQLASMYSFSRNLKVLNFSRVNIAEPEIDRFPAFLDAHAYSGELEPGDCLWIPSFWFHSLESLDALNVNLSYWWPPRAVSASPTAIRSALIHQMLTLLREKVKPDGRNPPLGQSVAGVQQEMERFVEYLTDERRVEFR